MSARRKRPLSPAEERSLAFQGLNLARQRKLGPDAASAAVGLSRSALMRHTEPAWRRVGRRLLPKTKDDLPREMVVLRSDGPTYETVIGSRQASLNASYHNAVRRYLERGDIEGLRAFRRKSLTVDGQRVPFVIDLAVLDRLAAGSELHYELYRR